MTFAFHVRPGLWYAALAGAAVAFGALVAVRPVLAVAAVTGAAVVALAFLAPVLHLTLLLGITLIVPFGILNIFSLGGANTAGLLISDVLLITGLLRAVIVLFGTPLDRRQLLSAAGVTVLVVVWTLQAAHGVLAGAPLSDTGFELRSLLGWSTLLVAMPLVADPRACTRLIASCSVVGLMLGLWGLFQYFGNVPFDNVGHFGVRQSVAFTSGARQIQGGLFGFPVAFLLSVAALASGERLRGRLRALVVAVAVTNGFSLLLTFQRTFWLATLAGFCFIVMTGGASQRVKSVLALVAVVACTVPVLAVVSPNVLGDAKSRLLSVSRYASDNSLRARLVESRAAVDKITDRPWTGWGLGDEVRWGMPWLDVPPRNYGFLHNGYIWMGWKLGLPATALLMALLLWALVARSPTYIRPLVARVRHGAQGTILAMLAIALTFPSFRVLVITPTLGVLLALCLMPLHKPQSADVAT